MLVRRYYEANPQHIKICFGKNWIHKRSSSVIQIYRMITPGAWHKAMVDIASDADKFSWPTLAYGIIETLALNLVS